MGQEDRALSARRGLVRAGPAARPDPTADAEAELKATLEEVTRLDAEIEALSEELAEFSRRWEQALGTAFQDLAAAERLVRRLQALEDGLLAAAERLRSDPAPARSRSRRGRAGRRRPSGRAEAEADAWTP
ncbi:MAG TPA: molecular chaperone DnaJ, partial [Anaeromyxobacter sp.]